MIRINKQSDEGYYLSLFTKRNDSLIIQSPVYWPKDSMCNISALAPFGVPGHGRFHIDMLTSENMVLSSDYLFPEILITFSLSAHNKNGLRHVFIL